MPVRRESHGSVGSTPTSLRAVPATLRARRRRGGSIGGRKRNPYTSEQNRYGPLPFRTAFRAELFR